MSDLRKAGEIRWPRDVRAELVNAIGALTTIVALAGVYAIAKQGFNLMLFYANYVLPVGAILVGAVCASGYGIAGWYTGLKMSPRLIWGVVAQLALAYFIAQYEMFRTFVPESSPLGFWQWFDATTRGFSFSKTGGGQFGVFGYAMRALELAGFVFGGWLVPKALSAKPYCEPCRTYQRTTTLVKLPAGPKRPAFGKPSADDELRLGAIAEEQMRALFAEALLANRASFNQLAKSLDATTVSLTAAMIVELVRCPRCFDGKLTASLVTGQGTQQPVRTLVAEQPLTKEQAKVLA